jgi:hypothetical protein
VKFENVKPFNPFKETNKVGNKIAMAETQNRPAVSSRKCEGRIIFKDVPEVEFFEREAANPKIAVTKKIKLGKKETRKPIREKAKIKKKIEVRIRKIYPEVLGKRKSKIIAEPIRNKSGRVTPFTLGYKPNTNN